MPQPELSCLQPQDLLLFEEQIRVALSRILPFKSGVITMPTEGRASSQSACDPGPQYEASARTLTIPLCFEQQVLGYFTTEETDLAGPETMLPVIQSAAGLVLENIALEKRQNRDQLTGLLNKTAFRSLLEQEIEHCLLSLLPEYAATTELAITSHRAGFGIILIGVDNMTGFNRAFGHLQGDELLKRTAARLKELCPQESVLGRLDGDVLSILFPAATAPKCQALSDEILAALSTFEHPVKVTRDPYCPGFSLGWTTYPKDIVGAQFRASAAEQACHVLEKAAMALDRAKTFGGRQAFSFSDILSRGSRVLNVIDNDRLMIDIGSLHSASVNQRFAIEPTRAGGSEAVKNRVQDHDPLAEVRVIETGIECSLAEVVTLGPFHVPIQTGDKLTLIASHGPSRDQDQTTHGQQHRQDIAPHPVFLNRITSGSESTDNFVLMLCQAASPTPADPGAQDVLSGILDLFQDMFRLQLPEAPLFGEYGPQTLSVMLPGTTSGDAHTMGVSLSQQWMEQTGSSLNVGIAAYPCLNDHRGDIWFNVQKALNHARLLTSDSVATFDSLSLTISADQAFSQEDLGTAIEEYKRALLLDEGNALARNSLGICYARTGKLNQALWEFRQVMTKDPESQRTLYNIGVVAIKMSDLELAKESFEHCLQLDPSQVFCHIRLGQVAEKQSDPETARHCFQRACSLPGGKALGHRHLGQLCLKQGQWEQAKTHFQRTLVHNPRDAQALLHLAEIYLDHDQDPDMAENMARLSVSLRPGQWRSMHVLEKILVSLDRKEEAEALRAWNSGLGRDAAGQPG